MKELLSTLLLLGTTGAIANTCKVNLFVNTSHFVKEEMPKLDTEIKNRVKGELSSKDYNVDIAPKGRSEFNLAIYYYGDERVYGYSVQGDDRAQYKMDRADWRASKNVDVRYHLYSNDGDEIKTIAFDSLRVEGKKKSEIEEGVVALVTRTLPSCSELRKN